MYKYGYERAASLLEPAFPIGLLPLDSKSDRARGQLDYATSLVVAGVAVVPVHGVCYRAERSQFGAVNCDKCVDGPGEIVVSVDPRGRDSDLRLDLPQHHRCGESHSSVAAILSLALRPRGDLPARYHGEDIDPPPWTRRSAPAAAGFHSGMAHSLGIRNGLSILVENFSPLAMGGTRAALLMDGAELEPLPNREPAIGAGAVKDQQPRLGSFWGRVADVWRRRRRDFLLHRIRCGA